MKHAAPSQFLPPRVADCADYFRRCRAEYAQKYKAARYLYQRHEMRQRVLHYGRLTRKLEGRTQ